VRSADLLANPSLEPRIIQVLCVVRGSPSLHSGSLLTMRELCGLEIRFPSSCGALEKHVLKGEGYSHSKPNI
jgi:hypothetical protein